MEAPYLQGGLGEESEAAYELIGVDGLALVHVEELKETIRLRLGDLHQLLELQVVK